MLIYIVYNIKVPKNIPQNSIFFYFPSIKKIYLLISKAQFVFPGEKTLKWKSVCRDFTRRVFLGSPSAGENEQGKKEYFPYLAEREILWSSINKESENLKGFPELGEPCWIVVHRGKVTGSFIALSTGHCMQAASGRKHGLVWGESTQLRALDNWAYGGCGPVAVAGSPQLSAFLGENRLVQCQDTFLVTYIDWLINVRVEKPLIWAEL